MSTLSPVADDHDLVLAARDGDDRAFEELYARYRKRITGYCLRLTQDLDRAEDLVQEIFISAFRRLRATEQPIVFRPWIYEIARNACIDDHRRRSRVREIPIEREGEGIVSQPWGIVPSPEVAMESKQRLDDLRGAFRGLSERHHRIIVLREFEGRSYSEIGDELGMSKIVVESTLFRARRRLNEEYEDLSTGRRCADIRQMLASDSERPLKSRGLRERRVLSRHLEHCPACRREARLVQLDDAAERAPIVKVALLLPLPLLRFPGRLGARLSGGGRGSSSGTLPAVGAIARVSDSAVLLVGGGRAAATAATLLVAAVGGGLATSAGLPAAGSGGDAARLAATALQAPPAPFGRALSANVVAPVLSWSSDGALSPVSSAPTGTPPDLGQPGSADHAPGSRPSGDAAPAGSSFGHGGAGRSGGGGGSSAPGSYGAGEVPGLPAVDPAASLPGGGVSPEGSGLPAGSSGVPGSTNLTGPSPSSGGAAGVASGAATQTSGTATGAAGGAVGSVGGAQAAGSAATGSVGSPSASQLPGGSTGSSLSTSSVASLGGSTSSGSGSSPSSGGSSSGSGTSAGTGSAGSSSGGGSAVDVPGVVPAPVG